MRYDWTPLTLPEVALFIAAVTFVASGIFMAAGG
jgi:hypothetical protein